MNDNLTMTEIRNYLIDLLINEITKINFNSPKIKNYFIKNSIEDNFKRTWGVFDKVYWKDIIKYSICSSACKDYKLGKLFKQSPNGIYDFIVGGYSFDSLRFDEESYRPYASEHGIMVLNIHNLDIYCYYKIDMGGCPTCGLGIQYSHPYYLVLYMSFSIDGLVQYCMSEFERNEIKLFFGI